MTVQIDATRHDDQSRRVNVTKPFNVTWRTDNSSGFHPNVSDDAIEAILGVMDSSASENKWLVKG
jgi:hypothetical protein